MDPIAIQVADRPNTLGIWDGATIEILHDGQVSAFLKAETLTQALEIMGLPSGETPDLALPG